MDDGSRGPRLANLDSECRWLNGPAFLTLPEEFWPADIAVPQEVSLATEVTSSPCVSDISKDSPLNPTRFSSWHKLLRLTCWILRFTSNCFKKSQDREHGALTMAEYENAKQIWIKRAQMEHFLLEAHGLKEKKSIPRQSRILTLSSFMDNAGIIRASGHLMKAPIPYSA